MSSPSPAAISAPLPLETPVVRAPDLETLKALLKNPSGPKDLQAYLMTEPWANALSSITTSLDTVPQRVGSVSLAAQTATIALTAIPTSGSVAVYEFSYLADITVPASVSSSLIVTVTFTQNGVTKNFSGAAITGNTNATVQSNFWTLVVDANTPVSYSTTYVSVGTAMTYGLTITLKSVNL